MHGPISSIVQPQNYYWNLVVQGAGDRLRRLRHGPRRRRQLARQLRRAPGRHRPERLRQHAERVPPAGASARHDQHVGLRRLLSSTTCKHNYFDVLPSVNFTFDLQKNLLLRVSAAETMSRPDYSALGAAVSLTDLTLTGNGGNPNLKPVTGGRLRRGAGVVLRADGGRGGQPVLRRPVVLRRLRHLDRQLPQPAAVEDRRARHAEQLVYSHLRDLIADQRLGSAEGRRAAGAAAAALQLRLPDQLHLRRWRRTPTAIRWSAPRRSPTTWSATTKCRCSTCAWPTPTARTTSSVSTAASPENEAGNGELDASANFNVTKNVTFTVDALNITNSLLKYYAANPTQVRAVYDNGTQVYAGVHVKF